MKYSLFLVDDHKVVRDGIKAMLLARPDIEVVGEAANDLEAKKRIGLLQPDLCFVDLKLPDGNGAELIAELKSISPPTKFALLTADPNPTDLKKARENGALGFLTKDMETDDYFRALDALIVGKRYISSVFSDIMINSNLAFTPREIDVLRGFADGLTYKEIGARLDVSPRTVETHKNNLLDKMQVKSIVEMVRLAIREGIVHP